MFTNPETTAVSSLALLEDFARRLQPRDGKLLRFAGIGEKDAYNCAVETVNGERIVAARIESRVNALDAETRFYLERADGNCEEIPGAPVFAMEDPAIALIGGEIIVSGVCAEWDKNSDKEPQFFGIHFVGLHMLFYRGTCLDDLHLFAKGPRGMKDIRLRELPDGRIFVCTRPQGGDAGLGKIGYVIIDTLEELSPQRLTEAAIIPGMFAEGEWGGVNKLCILDERTIGFLLHIGSKGEDLALHYAAATCMFNLETKTVSRLRIIATRKNFPPSEAKESRLSDVVFPGGLLKEGEDWILYAGLSDAVNGTTIIADPFGISE